MDMEATTEVQPMLLDVASVAKTLGLGRSKTWELLATGRIFSVRVGTRRLVPRDSLEKFVAALIAEQVAS